MIYVSPNIHGDDSVTVKVIEVGNIEGLGQPGVVCVCDESNLTKTNLLYRECVLVDRWKYETLLAALEKYQKPSSNEKAQINQ